VNLPTSGTDAGTFEVWFDSMGVAGATADILVDVTGYYSSTSIAEIETAIGNNSDAIAEIETAIGNNSDAIAEIETAIDNKSDAIAIIGSGGEDFGDIELDNPYVGYYWTGYDWQFLARDYIDISFHAFTSSDCSGKAFTNSDGLVFRDGVGKFFEYKDGGDAVTLASNAFRSVLEGGECNAATSADFLPGAPDGRFWSDGDTDPADVWFYEYQVVGVASPQLNAMWAYLVSGEVFTFVPRGSLNAAG